MDPTCYLSFPDDDASIAVEHALRSELRALGIAVLPPPTENDWGSSTVRPFHWLRQADAVLVDITGDSSWVAYEAGAAQVLNKRVILVARDKAATSPIEVELPRPFLYDPGREVGALADYVRQSLHHRFSTEQ